MVIIIIIMFTRYACKYYAAKGGITKKPPKNAKSFTFTKNQNVNIWLIWDIRQVCTIRKKAR